MPGHVGAIRKAVQSVVGELRRDADRLASLPAYGPDLAAAWRTAALLILLNEAAEDAADTEH